MAEPTEDKPASIRQVVEVRDSAGHPVAKAAITVTAASAPVPEMAYLTDEDGRLTLGLPAGPVTLEAVRGGRRTKFDAVVEAGTETTLSVTLD